MITAEAAIRQREQIGQGRYEAYRQWQERQMSDPRFASTRMLVCDIRDHGDIQDDTWERFDVEELTWAAEVIDGPGSHIDRFKFDGQDIIVKEADGVNPRLTLKQVYDNGLEVTRQEVAMEPRLAFQQRRDELFTNFYAEIERMMRDGTAHDTIHMISTCPVPSELSDDPDEAAELMAKKFYDRERGKSFDYTARRLPNRELELSATPIDNSNLAAHARVLQAYGYADYDFALETSQEYGRFLSFDTTSDTPIEVVIAARVAVFDEAMFDMTGRVHKYGRTDDIKDVQEFLRDERCDDYRAGYKAYNELLARHLAGGELSGRLRSYLDRCMDSQEQVGKSVLSRDEMDRLRLQLQVGTITMDMAMSCRELLVYDHHATLTRLFEVYNQTGEIPQLNYSSGGDFMDAYADSASSNGSSAAAAGETFAGCETATSVNSLSSAAQAAAVGGMSLEQALRKQQEEAAHCLRIQMFGFTIRHNVTCPFCNHRVDARDTATSIECLREECGTILDKATGKTSVRERLGSVEADKADEQTKEAVVGSVRLRSGQLYTVGQQTYRRELRMVIGGAEVTYVDPSGQQVTGVDAELLEAVIISQISAETQAG